MNSREFMRQLRLTADPEERARLSQLQNPNEINLAVAENVLIFPFLRANLFNKVGDLKVSDTKYVKNYGEEEYRKGAAEFLGKAFNWKGLPWEYVFGVSGVSAALECLAFTLCQPGDIVITPAPCWQGFQWCFTQRPQLQLKPFEVSGGAEPFNLTLQNVIDAYEKVYDEDNPQKRPRLLVLTNPNNPLGVNYDKGLLEEIYTWALNKTELHIISDELYCHSQVGAQSPEPPFVSAFALNAYQRASDEKKARVHVVWGFAKDFGLSGFKAAFIASSSEAVKRSMSGTQLAKDMAWFSPFDSLKQFTLRKLFSKERRGQPEQLADLAMVQYKKDLTMRHTEVMRALAFYKIKFWRATTARPNFAQFFWLDLRDYLKYFEQTPDAPGNRSDGVHLFADLIGDQRESRLHAYIKSKAEVNLLPGLTLSSPVPGFFRLCYTAVYKNDAREDMVVKAIKKVAEKLAELKPDQKKKARGAD